VAKFPAHRNLEGVRKIDPGFQGHQMECVNCLAFGTLAFHGSGIGTEKIERDWKRSTKVPNDRYRQKDMSNDAYQ
jgi:alpha-glucuronidase